MTASSERSHFMRLPEVRQRTSLSRSQIYRMVKAGDFPRQAKLSERCAGWWSEEVDAWAEKRRAESGPP